MEEFIGVTISDLNDKYLPLTIKSINSFLKFHNTKLIVYIVGNNELPIQDNRIEIIHIPATDYTNYNLNIINKKHYKHINIFIAKLICLIGHNNFIFFENDVFFLKNMKDIWSNMCDGTGFIPIRYSLMNSGLIIAKNTNIFNYTEKDIIKYYTENMVCNPCDEFLTSWCANQLRRLNDNACVIAMSYNYHKKIHLLDTCHSVHCVSGKQFIANPQRYKKIPEFINELIKKIN